MKHLITFSFLLVTSIVYSQTYKLHGNIADDTGKPIPNSTAVLLNPADSVLEFYCIANKSGQFEISNIKKGNYLLQIAYIGYETIYKYISFPYSKSDLGIYVMKQIDESLDEVTVTGEHVPISIKKDTIEYNANAFKTKSDAVVEDLLKKLPGVKVDRAGNIKAMGENVNKLLVDGKEFFGNDPKVASKNLPADAIDKVQLYDGRSDESEFTGIDDGSREKTINLQLKDDKKNSLFGDISCGYGSEEHYSTNAKAYRFNNKIQFALLGMINNINQFGFSFKDYLNFNGGVASLMSGSGSAKIEISDDNSFPVNFGQPVNGIFTSGAGGFNFSHSKDKHNRIFISYLGNGTNKFLDQITHSRYFTNEGSYDQIDSINEHINDEAHRINFGYRNRIDSSQNFIINVGFNLGKNKKTGDKFHYAYENDLPINSQDLFSYNRSVRIYGSMNGSYIKKFKNKRSIFKFNFDGFLSKIINDNAYNNRINYFLENDVQQSNNFQDNETDKINYTTSVSLIQKTSKIFYIVPSIKYGRNIEELIRVDGLISDDKKINPENIEFQKRYDRLNPGISFKRNTEKAKFSFKLATEMGQLMTGLSPENIRLNKYIYLTPSINYEYEYKTGRRINLLYYSDVETPGADQLLPVVNKLNVLSTFRGNPDLKPEYNHSANANWWIFDQFSFTSFVTGIQAKYTINKINWSTNINDKLEQENTLLNTKDNKSLRGNIDFSTPVRKLGILLNLNLEESYEEAINVVNNIENTIKNHNSRLSFSIENRKKEKLDVITGIGMNLSNAYYSLQTDLNRQYLDMYCFGEIHYSPIDKIDFGITADITKYTDQSFSKSVQIPLLNAEINWRFLKHNRAQLNLNAFDILNQNIGIRRISELNYLKEIKSNTIGRYIMLSLKIRINKFETNDGLDIEINGRR